MFEIRQSYKDYNMSILIHHKQSSNYTGSMTTRIHDTKYHVLKRLDTVWIHPRTLYNIDRQNPKSRIGIHSTLNGCNIETN